MKVALANADTPSDTRRTRRIDNLNGREGAMSENGNATMMSGGEAMVAALLERGCLLYTSDAADE